MFERFTDRARRAVVLAREEAASRGHLEVTTGHLLLGLLREEEADGTGRGGIAAQALRVLGVTFADTSEAMDGYWGRNAPTTGHLPVHGGDEGGVDRSTAGGDGSSPSIPRH